MNKRKISINKLIIFDLILLNIALSKILSQILNIEVLSTILVVINTLCVGVLLLKKKDKINIIIFISLILRIVIIYFDLYGRNFFVLPNSGADTEMFYKKSIMLNDTERQGYVLFLNLLFKLIGPQRILFQYVNVIFSILTLLLLKKILREINIDEGIINNAIIILCFLPINLIISSILLREPLMILLNTTSIYYFTCWLLKDKKGLLIKSLFFILLSTYFHSSMIMCGIAYLFTYIFFDKNNKKFIFNKKSIGNMIFSITTIIVIVVFLRKVLFGYFEELNNLEKILQKMQDYSNGGSLYLESFTEITSVGGLILISPIKFIYLFGSPMPWDWRNILDICTFLCSSLFYLYTFLLVIKDNGLKNTDFGKIYFLCILMVGLAYGMSCFTAGSAMRHREKTIPFFIILYSILKDYELRNKYKRNKEEKIN